MQTSVREKKENYVGGKALLTSEHGMQRKNEGQQQAKQKQGGR